MAALVRHGLWRWLQGTGLERFALWREDAGWVLRGTILAQGERGPVESRYEVACDGAWRTRRVEVSLSEDGSQRRLRLEAEDGRWYAEGREHEAVRGCLDVDLNWSPSTNTLPLRRLSPAVGAGTGPVTAAWVRFPQLTLEPLPQEYLRVSEQRYRYTSRHGAFTAEIEVDQDGLVVSYGDLWSRVAEDQQR